MHAGLQRLLGCAVGANRHDTVTLQIDSRRVRCTRTVTVIKAGTGIATTTTSATAVRATRSRKQLRAVQSFPERDQAFNAKIEIPTLVEVIDLAPHAASSTPANAKRTMTDVANRPATVLA